MAHPLYSPDSAPCELFLFGAMKHAFAGQHFANTDGFPMSMEAFVRGLSADFLQTVIQEWIRRSQLSCEGGRETVQTTLQNGIFAFVIARIGDENRINIEHLVVP
jgi:hypothetical protein